MKCVILAAGYATRLYPLTENFPKPLLEIKNKTIIDWLIDDIEESKEVSEYIIISNHKFYNHFVDWKDKKKISTKITILDDGTTSNETRLGAVKDIAFAIDKLKLDDDLLVLAGDNILDFSLQDFINYFKEHNSTCIMRYYTEDEKRLKKSANIKIDSNDKVLEMIEKPDVPISNWCCPAFYIYSKEDVEKVNKALSDGCGYDAPGSFICWLHKKSSVYAYNMPGKRYDIGTLETYEEVKNSFNGINN